MEYITIKTLDKEHHVYAAQLIVDIYNAEGYIKHKNKSAYKKVQTSLKKKETESFGVFDGDILVGTISVFEGRKNPLPMEIIYQEEVEGIRKNGHKVVEVGYFAVNKKYLKEKNYGSKHILDTTTLLMKEVFSHCRKIKGSAICIAINPKHEAFYNSLGFEDVGKLKSHPSVNNAPALAKVLELDPLMESFHNGSVSNGLLRDIIGHVYSQERMTRIIIAGMPLPVPGWTTIRHYLYRVTR